MSQEIKDIVRKFNESGPSRTGEIRATKGEDEQYRFDISFSSETEEVERFFGVEILGHREDEADLSRLNSGGHPLLVDHDREKLVGVVESARIEGGRGRSVVRFGTSEYAQEIREDVINGIRTNTSVGYNVTDAELVGTREDGMNKYRVKWSPFEITLASIPADTSVGVNRSEGNPIVKKEPEKMENIQVKTDPEAERLLKEAREAEQRKLDESHAAGVRSKELQRIADLEAYGEQHNMKDQAREAIKKGTSVEDFRTQIIDTVAERSNNTATTDNLSKQEARDIEKWSLLKACRDIHTDKKLTGVEAEMHQEGVKEYREAGYSVKGNLVIPTAVMNYGKRDFTVGTEGTDVVQTTLQPLIERLRDKLILRDMGARFLTGLTGDLQFPRQTNNGTFNWEGENDTTAESTLTTDNVSLSPNRGGLFFDISNQAIIQSSPDVEQMHRDDLLAVVARAFDSAGISGTGASNQPTGITNTSGIGSVVAGNPDGAALTWGDIVDLESEVAVDNADVGNLRYLTNTSVRGKLKQTETTAGTNGQFIWPVNGTSLNGYEGVGISNLVPSNGTKGAGTDLSTIIFGNFNDLIMAMWGGMDILVDPYTQAALGLLRLHLQIYADVAVRHPESFAACTDVVTA